MAVLRSGFAVRPILIDGLLDTTSWVQAGTMTLPNGRVLVKNDLDFVYIALDMTGDLGNDVGDGDYLWVSFDVDRNRAISPRRDVNYAIPRSGTWEPAEPGVVFPFIGHAYKLGRQHYLGANSWTGLLPEPTRSTFSRGFRSSEASASPHRIWELRIDLRELGIDLRNPASAKVLHFGLRVASSSPAFTTDSPPGFFTDFSSLHEIHLATAPTTTFTGSDGPAIGGVGLIPFTAIDARGYATTPASYTMIRVTEYAFGGALNIIGNRTTLTSLWGGGVRRYRVLHRFGTTAPFTPLLTGWNNYRWNGSTYVLETFGPDSAGTYPLQDPGVDYSVDDLLLHWNTAPEGTGAHQLRVEFLDGAGNPVAPLPTAQTLTLAIDNNAPSVRLLDLLHGGNPIRACSLESFPDPADGVQVLLSARDPEGNLAGYKVEATWGDNRYALLYSDTFPSTVDAAEKDHTAHTWFGFDARRVPPTPWRPSTTCAYRFRVTATSRITNGYGDVSPTVEDSRHVTLVIPSASTSAGSEFPFGMPGGKVA